MSSEADVETMKSDELPATAAVWSTMPPASEQVSFYHSAEL